MHNKKFPRLLVIAGYPPEGGGGGGVILRSVLEQYPGEQLAWLGLRPDRTKRHAWFRPGLPRWIFPLYLPQAISGFVGMRASMVMVRIFNWLAVLYARIVLFRFRPTDILIVVDYALLAPIVRLVERQPSLYVHLSVHDDPLLAAQSAKRWSGHTRVAELFERLCARAVSMDCISQRMADRYRLNLGVSPIVITRCIGKTRLAEFERKPVAPRHGRLDIILGGWGDCPAPWPDNLLQALRELRRDMDVYFHTFDPRVQSMEGETWIVHHRHLPEIEFDSLLVTMDLSYAPDPLTAEGRLFAASSLSTKVVTSICAGIPFIYHGPADSTVGDMLKIDSRIGVIVESQDPREIATAIRFAASHYTGRVEACRTFARDHFGAAGVQARFLGRFENTASGVHRQRVLSEDLQNHRQ